MTRGCLRASANENRFILRAELRDGADVAISYAYDVTPRSVFVATDGNVEEVDVRNPRRPTLLNRYQLPAEARRLRVMPGRRLFVFTGTGGMQIIKL